MMPEAMNALIIEDEELAALRLRKLLSVHDDHITIIGQASNGKEGMEMIERLKPDVIFLDIQMPVMNGLEMVMQLTEQPFIVFTTAYDEYALQSFEENSIDYLLKPIQPERLQKTINKLKAITGKKAPEQPELEQLQRLLEQLQTAQTQPQPQSQGAQESKKISLIRANVGDRIVIIKLHDVQYFKAEDKLTKVVTSENKEYFISPSLTQLLPKLPDEFIQINRSHIVNEDYVAEIRKGFNRKLHFDMQNDTRITVGSSFQAELQERWKL